MVVASLDEGDADMFAPSVFVFLPNPRLAEFSVLVKHRFEYETAPLCFVLFPLSQRFIRQVLFLPFEKAELSRPV